MSNLPQDASVDRSRNLQGGPVDKVQEMQGSAATPQVPEGYQLVPVVLTKRMRDAYREARVNLLSSQKRWEAMLSAAKEGGK